MEEKCENCAYYVQHYVQYGSEINAVACGHCRNHQLSPARRKKLSVCALWESAAFKKAKERESIENTLNHIAEQLSMIIALLKINNHP